MIGTILRQRYKIIQKLGEGGFGKTYLAEDLDIPTNPKPKCVVKVLDPHPNNQNIPEEDILRLFNQEAETLYKLGQSHDQIPKLYAYFEDRKELHIVQEFIDGNDLSQEIISGQPWSETEVIKFLEEILEVLAFVHQNNVIHRDIKPSNILRRTSDNKLVLIDFGLVKTSTISGNFTPSIPIGSRGYAPPEQGRGRPQLSSDIYALGIIAIQALTGIDNPLKLEEDANGEIIWQEHTQVSNKLAEVLTKMVRYDFKQRYQNADEALQDLKQNILIVSSSCNILKPIKIKDKYGYINKIGQITILPQFDEANNFCEDLARVKINNKYGYINKIGQLVIPPQFDDACNFYENLSKVKINYKYGYIDRTGQLVIPPQFDYAEEFSENLAVVDVNLHCGYIDRTGQLVIPPQFDDARNFNEGLAPIEIDRKFGYLGKSGQIVIPAQFDNASNFYEDIAWIAINGKYGFINKLGQNITDICFDYVGKFSEGMAYVKIKKHYGYINKFGENTIPIIFNHAEDFAEGLAAIQKGNKWGYINKSGQIVIDCKFDRCYNFSDGMALVEIDNKKRYIDKYRKFIF
ncbi:MAG TPA: WG repeat-containing protein [Nostocaceae cyanobacterium]|nr:WG repeat-containing protein [Nostocaceae cyanobacterium]